jgi:hypothetical protein
VILGSVAIVLTKPRASWTLPLTSP